MITTKLPKKNFPSSFSLDEKTLESSDFKFPQFPTNAPSSFENSSFSPFPSSFALPHVFYPPSPSLSVPSTSSLDRSVDDSRPPFPSTSSSAFSFSRTSQPFNFSFPPSPFCSSLDENYLSQRKNVNFPISTPLSPLPSSSRVSLIKDINVYNNVLLPFIIPSPNSPPVSAPRFPNFPSFEEKVTSPDENTSSFEPLKFPTEEEEKEAENINTEYQQNADCHSLVNYKNQLINFNYDKKSNEALQPANAANENEIKFDAEIFKEKVEAEKKAEESIIMTDTLHGDEEDGSDEKKKKLNTESGNDLGNNAGENEFYTILSKKKNDKLEMISPRDKMRGVAKFFNIFNDKTQSDNNDTNNGYTEVIASPTSNSLNINNNKNLATYSDKNVNNYFASNLSSTSALCYSSPVNANIIDHSANPSFQKTLSLSPEVDHYLSSSLFKQTSNYPVFSALDVNKPSADLLLHPPHLHSGSFSSIVGSVPTAAFSSPSHPHIPNSVPLVPNLRNAEVYRHQNLNGNDNDHYVNVDHVYNNSRDVTIDTAETTIVFNANNKNNSNDFIPTERSVHTSCKTNVNRNYYDDNFYITGTQGTLNAALSSQSMHHANNVNLINKTSDYFYTNDEKNYSDFAMCGRQANIISESTNVKNDVNCDDTSNNLILDSSKIIATQKKKKNYSHSIISEYKSTIKNNDKVRGYETSAICEQIHRLIFNNKIEKKTRYKNMRDIVSVSREYDMHIILPNVYEYICNIFLSNEMHTNIMYFLKHAFLFHPEIIIEFFTPPVVKSLFKNPQYDSINVDFVKSVLIYKLKFFSDNNGNNYSNMTHNNDKTSDNSSSYASNVHSSNIGREECKEILNVCMYRAKVEKYVQIPHSLLRNYLLEIWKTVPSSKPPLANLLYILFSWLNNKKDTLENKKDVYFMIYIEMNLLGKIKGVLWVLCAYCEIIVRNFGDCSRDVQHALYLIQWRDNYNYNSNLDDNNNANKRSNDYVLEENVSVLKILVCLLNTSGWEVPQILHLWSCLCVYTWQKVLPPQFLIDFVENKIESINHTFKKENIDNNSDNDGNYINNKNNISDRTVIINANNDDIKEKKKSKFISTKKESEKSYCQYNFLSAFLTACFYLHPKNFIFTSPSPSPSSSVAIDFCMQCNSLIENCLRIVAAKAANPINAEDSLLLLLYILENKTYSFLNIYGCEKYLVSILPFFKKCEYLWVFSDSISPSLILLLRKTINIIKNTIDSPPSKSETNRNELLSLYNYQKHNRLMMTNNNDLDSFQYSHACRNDAGEADDEDHQGTVLHLRDSSKRNCFYNNRQNSEQNIPVKNINQKNLSTPINCKNRNAVFDDTENNSTHLSNEIDENNMNLMKHEKSKTSNLVLFSKAVDIDDERKKNCCQVKEKKGGVKDEEECATEGREIRKMINELSYMVQRLRRNRFELFLNSISSSIGAIHNTSSYSSAENFTFCSDVKHSTYSNTQHHNGNLDNKYSSHFEEENEVKIERKAEKSKNILNPKVQTVNANGCQNSSVITDGSFSMHNKNILPFACFPPATPGTPMMMFVPSQQHNNNQNFTADLQFLYDNQNNNQMLQKSMLQSNNISSNTNYNINTLYQQYGIHDGYISLEMCGSSALPTTSYMMNTTSFAPVYNNIALPFPHCSPKPCVSRNFFGLANHLSPPLLLERGGERLQQSNNFYFSNNCIGATENEKKNEGEGKRMKYLQLAIDKKDMNKYVLFKVKSNKMTGLANLGNTCYLNSFLQALFLTDGFLANIFVFDLNKKNQVFLGVKKKSNKFLNLNKNLFGEIRNIFANMLLTERFFYF